ncbi:kinase-like domain-containing protein [Aspergillus egyptiacus]|nr:kinase-like domain-containing protein [Aspergillus egyptiacus]
MPPSTSPSPQPALPTPFSLTTSDTTNLKAIYQGAEAHLYKTTFLSPPIPAALKIRPPKPYRHPILDRRLTRARILQEARCLHKLVKEGVSVPAVLGLDWEGGWLCMEWVEGVVVRVLLERWEGFLKRELQERKRKRGEDEEAGKRDIGREEEEKVRGLMRRIGGTVGGLHRAGVIHGDLTTSNLMLRRSDDAQNSDGDLDMDGEGGGSPCMEGEVVLIDFGLAGQSSQDEDRAVDLYVLERAFGSSHPRAEKFFDEVLEGYRASYKGAGSALKRLEDVRMRGRKRSMIG